MAETVSLSLRVTPEKAHQVEELAKSTDRSRSWLLEQALDAYLESQSWQVAHMKKGMEELDRGQGVSHEGVAGWLAGWGTDGEGDPPG